MSNDDNFLEDVKNHLRQAIQGDREALKAARGPRPYMGVRLSADEQREYWSTLPPSERKAQLGKMDSKAQERLWKRIGGE